jgi:invasion protein IalB
LNQTKKDLLTMKIITLVSACAVSAFLMGGAAYAIDAAPAAPAKPASTSSMSTTTHSAKSVECSKEADAKGLHGKERKKFREECKKGK